jgi:anti-sigma factor RsiW
MATESRHYREEIQELLDNRLSASMRSEVEAHLEVCELCRHEMEALRWTKQFAKQQLAPGSVPSDLEERLMKALDQEARDRSEDAILWVKRRPILAYGFMLLVAVLLVLSYFIHSPTLPDQIMSDFGDYKSERLALQFRGPDVAAMEKYFAEHGIPFRTRVFDLGMMQYRLVGGRVHQLINRRSALFVYQGDSNKIVVCQMYPGNVSELPPAGELRRDRGFTFHIYRSRGLTAVFWQEREITCVLVSDINSEEVIQLAIAKAMI